MAKRIKWGTVEYLQQKIDDYFDTCFNAPEDKRTAPTIPGLCLWIDISKESWAYYTNKSNPWQTSRRKAAAEDQEQREERILDMMENEIMEDIDGTLLLVDNTDLRKGVDDEYYSIKAQVALTLKKAAARIEDFNIQMTYKLRNPAGAIFYLKNAFLYSDAPAELAAGNTETGSSFSINITLDDPSEDVKTLEGSSTKALGK